jgi:hypothetical protein
VVPLNTHEQAKACSTLGLLALPAADRFLRGRLRGLRGHQAHLGFELFYQLIGAEFFRLFFDLELLLIDVA